jgi:spore coat protein CotF
MNNNMVQNQEQQIPKTEEMNDSDYLNDILNMEKNMTNIYSIVLNEASNDPLYNELFMIFKETQECQRKLFNLLFAKGWYKLEKAETQKISAEFNEHQNKMNELPQ